MPKSFKPLRLLFFLLTCICFSSPVRPGSYEEVLDENHRTLSQWSIPIVLLSIESSAPNSSDGNLLSLQVRVLEIYRKGSVNIKKGNYKAEWRTYKERAEIYAEFSSKAKAEPAGKDLLESLTKEKLICFTGQSLHKLTLYAYDCFTYNGHNDTIAREESRSKPLPVYLHEYSQTATPILPLIAFILVFFLPKTGISIASLTFPSFAYYNAQISDTTIRYDYLFAYPAMVLSFIVIILGVILLLRQMIKKEQEEKARAIEYETPNSN